ncbi:MAG TPA: ABC transporter permease, partial [Puia sp.]|nr:ABC transporter permease [Puia sp.]
MLKNYFLIAWRHLIKNKGYTAINLAGLAIGMAITLLIGVWIADELAFDHYHSNHRRIGQVLLQQARKGEPHYTGPAIAPVTGPTLDAVCSDLFPRTAMSINWGTHLVNYGDKQLARNVYYAQHTLPELFTFKMLAGTAGSLQDPSTALLSHSTAVALFGNDNPVNKVFKYENHLEMKVGGVYEDLPSNSTFHDAEILMPANSTEMSWFNHGTNWTDHGVQLYVQMADGVTMEQATARIRNLPTAHVDDWLEELMVYPLDKMHLHGEFVNGVASGGRIQYVVLFGLIGGFVLLLACINFMNLSTAKSEQRAKEVGIRKSVGSLRGQLIGQFLGESVLMALLSFGLALILAWVSMRGFNSLAGKELTLPFASPIFWTMAMGFTLLTGILAGSYPAFYLSGFDAVKVLKGSFRMGRYAGMPRKILVVLQFSVSLTLIIA